MTWDCFVYHLRLSTEVLKIIHFKCFWTVLKYLFANGRHMSNGIFSWLRFACCLFGHNGLQLYSWRCNTRNIQLLCLWRMFLTSDQLHRYLWRVFCWLVGNENDHCAVVPIHHRNSLFYSFSFFLSLVHLLIFIKSEYSESLLNFFVLFHSMAFL